MMLTSIPSVFSGLIREARNLSRDNSGIAATEFAVIVPLMLVMFFGTVEISSAVAVDRKVTLVARTLSDLVSQSTSVTSNDLTNFFTASNGIMTPYPSAPTKAKISQIYIDPATLVAKVKWSKASNDTAHSCNEVVSVPTGLATAGAYLILSEVSYDYTPTVGYVIKVTKTLSDKSYTRPRQTTNVPYSDMPSPCT